MDHRWHKHAGRWQTRDGANGTRAAWRSRDAPARSAMHHEALRPVHRARTTSRSTCRDGRVRLLPRALGLRQDHAAARDRRPRPAGRRHDRDRRPRRVAPAAGRARLRHRVPVLRAVSQPHGRGECRLRPRQPPRRRGPRSTRASPSCSRSSACPSRARNIRCSSPAASSSASRSRARSRPRRACCCSTSRSPRSMRACACACATRSRQLQRRLGVTTIMVTHDQEEALAMADRIVVMNQGVIEQVGTPPEIYRKPATAFVADFVGTMTFLDARGRRARRRCASARSSLPATGANGLPHGAARPHRLAAGGDPRPQHRRARRRTRSPTRVSRPRFPRLVLPRAARARGGAASVAILADFSANLMRDLAVAEGPDAHHRAAAGVAARVREGTGRRVSVDRHRRMRPPATRVARIVARRDRLMRLGVVAAGRLAAARHRAAARGRCCRRASRTATAQFVGLANYIRYFSTPACSIRSSTASGSRS